MPHNTIILRGPDSTFHRGFSPASLCIACIYIYVCMRIPIPLSEIFARGDEASLIFFSLFSPLYFLPFMFSTRFFIFFFVICAQGEHERHTYTQREKKKGENHGLKSNCNARLCNLAAFNMHGERAHSRIHVYTTYTVCARGRHPILLRRAKTEILSDEQMERESTHLREKQSVVFFPSLAHKTHMLEFYDIKFNFTLK